MTETYNDALKEQARQNVWQSLKKDASNMSAGDVVGLTADVAGFFDPTPISDGVGAVISLVKGDPLGAGLSLLGMLPYIGDAGKIAKIRKLSPGAAAALQAVMTKGDELASLGERFLKNNFTLQQIAHAREKAAKKVREALLKAKNDGIASCKECAKLKDKNGVTRELQMPTGESGGTWKTDNGLRPKDGTALYVFDSPRTLPNGTKVDSIQFRDGYPDFSPYTFDGKHTLWEVTGDAPADQRALIRQMRESNPGYMPPDTTKYVLHHFEDGTVGYIPKSIHNKGVGGASHTGGNSIVNNELF